MAAKDCRSTSQEFIALVDAAHINLRLASRMIDSQHYGPLDDASGAAWPLSMRSDEVDAVVDLLADREIKRLLTALVVQQHQHGAMTRFMKDVRSWA